MKLNKAKNIIGKSPKNFSNEGIQRSTESFSEIAEIISLIAKVDFRSPQAKANITSFSDNNGKRILL